MESSSTLVVCILDVYVGVLPFDSPMAGPSLDPIEKVYHWMNASGASRQRIHERTRGSRRKKASLPRDSGEGGFDGGPTALLGVSDLCRYRS